MSDTNRKELYQQVILDHNRAPKNFRVIEGASHTAEGYNPLCGDHLHVYLNVNSQGMIEDISFEGDGCAISRASASLMTSTLKGRPVESARELYEEFHRLVKGELDPDQQPHHLGKLAIFSGIWHFPARVKCASLCWHAMQAALNKEKTASTE